MSINKDIFDNHDLDIFDDDFEVIYEGDLPDIPMPEDDNFQDVLSNLSDLDRTKNIDYLEENYTTSFDLDEKTKEKYEKASKKKKKKICRIFLSLWRKLQKPEEKRVQRRSTKRQIYFSGALH